MRRLVGLAVLLAAVSQSVASAAPDPIARRVRAYRSAHELAILDELTRLLAIPNVSSDRENIRANADAIVALCARRGMKATLLESEGSPPAVLAELAVPGARRTVVFYAHYDGQPVDPSRWVGNPWQPVLRTGPLESGGKEVARSSLSLPLDPDLRVYGRSSSDDKAPIVGLLAALDALRAAGLSPSVNVKFFFEGEEEAGSPHLAGMLRAHEPRLAADLWLFCDGPVHQSGRKLVFFGARGITDVELTAYGAGRRLHSGHYGNWSPNPAIDIARLLASMRDDDGRILIPGFADDVRPPTAAERRAVAEAPDVDRELRRELGIGRTLGGGARVEASVLLPALNVRGLAAADVGLRATNSIPTEATASLDFRLVPNQTPDKVRQKVEAYLRGRGYHLVRSAPDRDTLAAHPRVLRVEWGAGYPPSRTPMELPVARAVARIVAEAAGGAVVRLPTLGGSVPIHVFEQVLRATVVGVPIANHDNNQHAANENLRLGNLWDGIEIYAALMAGLGKGW